MDDDKLSFTCYKALSYALKGSVKSEFCFIILCIINHYLSLRLRAIVLLVWDSIFLWIQTARWSSLLRSVTALLAHYCWLISSTCHPPLTIKVVLNSCVTHCYDFASKCSGATLCGSHSKTTACFQFRFFGWLIKLHTCVSVSVGLAS